MTKTVAVAAVKGGVGKTLVALNLARMLAERGHSVALLDADLDNANFCNFTGAEGEIMVDQEKRFIPYEWNGIQVFSMSLIAGREKAVSMTGDRYMQILEDVATRSRWGDPDFMVVDLPAGSSDVFQCAMEIFAKTLVGNVVVTQPTVIDATRRVLNLHRYLEIPVIGVVENMSYFMCPRHKKEVVWHIFGEGKTRELAEQFDVAFLGEIPLSMKVAEGISRGDPILPSGLSSPIEAACDALEKAEIPKTGFIDRLKKVAVDAVKPEIERVLASLIVTARRELDIDNIRKDVGFTDEAPIMFVITDDSDRKEITRIALKLTENGFVALKNPKRLDFEIACSFRTLARMIMGQRKMGGDVVPFDPIDAWLMSDVKVYGRGHSPRAVEVFRSIFSSSEIMGPIRDRYGGKLGRWI